MNLSDRKLLFLGFLFLATTSQAQVVVTTPGQQSSSCLATVNQIALRESTVTDTSVARTYTLCPGTYAMGKLNFDNVIINGQRMLPLRSNMKVQCGEDGSRTNGCILTGGDLHVDGTNHFGISAEPMENVVLQGLTFRNVTKYMAWFNRPGTVEFVDCEFRDNEYALASQFLDFFDAKNRDLELSVSYKGCLFDNNRFYGFPAQPALIVGNGLQNRLIVESNRFTNNNMLYNNTLNETNSFLIETSGPITMIGNCFEENQVGVSPVAVYGKEYLFGQNFQSFSAGKVCIMSSHFETAESYELFQPRCERFDIRGFGAVCPLDGTSAPTDPPAPTVSPTIAPTPLTPFPSHSPSISPAPSTIPSWYPTPQPTPKPTPFPTGEDGSVRTNFPTFPLGSTPTPVPTAKPTLQESTTFSGDRPTIGIQLTDPPTPDPESGASKQSGFSLLLLLGVGLFICL